MIRYAFDDCSILHMCELKIKESYQQFVGKVIAHENCSKLNTLLVYLRNKNISYYRFVPANNFEVNSIHSYNQILQKVGNVQILGEVFRKEMLDQLELFYDKLKDEFKEMEKGKDIEKIKLIFINNEKELKKERNIPEDDDLKIISGYMNYNEAKYFISEDEHFWGYRDLIFKEFGIEIVEEWNVHKLIL